MASRNERLGKGKLRVTKATSNATGVYTIPLLTPDTYTITATATG
jgi:hypothetical protein